MKRSFCVHMVIVLLAILVFSGCEERANTTTLQLRFLAGGTRSATTRDPVSPEGQGLAITGYTISGEGPNGKTFTITTSSAQVEINGLVIGTWEIDVVGSNQQGTTIAVGNATHHLTTKDNSVEVILDECEGTGYVEIDFSWGDTDFSAISLDLKLRPQGGEQTTITQGKTLDPATASARYTAELQTGSYELTFNLYSDGVQIGGGIVAIRILSDMTSSRSIPIIIDKLPPEATGLYISSRVADPVVGTIDNIGSTILPNTPVVAEFSKTGGGGTLPVQVDWYLDGKFLTTGNSVEFSTFTGAHRLDAITKTDSLGSVGSETHPFRASVDSLDGIPITVEAVAADDTDDNMRPYFLTDIADTAFLRDGNLLIASAEGLQICAIQDDRLFVLKNFIGDGIDPLDDPYPTVGITDIEVDTMADIVCTTARSTGVVAFYRYNPATCSMIKIGALTPGTEGHIWDTDISNAVMDIARQRVYFADFIESAGNSFIFHVSYANDTVGEVSNGTCLLTGTIDGIISDPVHITIDQNGSRLAVANPTTKSFYTYRITEMLDIDCNGSYVESDPSREGPYLLALTGGILQAVWDDGIHKYAPITTGTHWDHMGPASDRTDPVPDMVFDNQEENGWVIHGGTYPSIHHISLLSGAPIYSYGSMETGSFLPDKISYSPMGNFLSISGGNELRLLRISDS